MCVTSNETEQISSGHGIAYFLKVVEVVQCEIVSVFVVQHLLNYESSVNKTRHLRNFVLVHRHTQLVAFRTLSAKRQLSAEIAGAEPSVTLLLTRHETVRNVRPT